ncbi:MAG: T9SS type A sorting domain-containing protein [Fluviicola sp.]
MKRLPLLVFLLCFAVSGKAQNYLPFPDSAAIWVNAGYSVSQSGASLQYSEYFCANGQDTLIDNVEYTKMESCINGDYIGAFRDSAGIVFYLPKDSIGERLIYDLSASPGDTLNFYAEDQVYGIGWFDYTLSEWDTASTIINGVNRRAIYIDGEQWIEGIGCTSGFLQVPFGNVSNYAPMLYCMSHLDTILYGNSASQSGQNVACDFFIGLNELEKEKIEVFPNPVEDKVNFTTELQIHAILISNVEGKSITADFKQQGNTISVSMEFLPPGSYLMMIKTNEVLYKANVIKQ